MLFFQVTWNGSSEASSLLQQGTNAKFVHFQSDQEEHAPVYLALGRVHGYFAKSHSQSHSHEDRDRLPQAGPNRTEGQT